MDDKELLELAAKAVDIRLEWDGNPKEWQPIYYEGKTYHYWNPLTDDGDALRLAVKLQIIVGKYDEYANAGGISNDVDIVIWNHEENDPYAATRRAIVRAAAALGESV